MTLSNISIEKKYKILKIVLAIIIISGIIFACYFASNSYLKNRDKTSYESGYLTAINDTLVYVRNNLINELNTRGYINIADDSGHTVTLKP